MPFTPYSRYEYQETDISAAEGWHRDPGPENIWAKQEIEITGEVQRVSDLPAADPDAETEDGQRRTYYVRTRGAVYRDTGSDWEVIWGRGDADFPLPGTSYFESAQVSSAPSADQDVVRQIDLDNVSGGDHDHTGDTLNPEEVHAEFATHSNTVDTDYTIPAGRGSVIAGELTGTGSITGDGSLAIIDEGFHESGSGLTAVRDASTFDGATGGEKIQAAIDDLPSAGGLVFVPSEGPDTNGRWDVSSTIVLPSNTTLSGVSGATRLFLTADTDADVVSTATDDTATNTPKENITIEGIHIDGNGANQSATSGTTYLYGSCGIRPLNVNGCTVRDCTVVDAYKHGIEVKRSKNATVRNCTVGNAGDDGISVTDTLFDTIFTENVVIEDCRAYGAADTGMEVDDGPQNVHFKNCVSHDNSTNGFVIHTHQATDPPRGTTDDTYAPGAPQEIYFTDCASVNNGRLGFAVGHHSSGEPRDYFLDGVSARGNGESPFREEISEASDSSVEITNVNVTNFYFEGASTQNAANGFTAGIKLDRAMPWNDLTFSNGIITGTLGYGIFLRDASITGLTVDNVSIEGTNLESDAVFGAMQDNGNVIEDFRFTDCTVKNGPAGAIALNPGATDEFLNGQISDCTVKNNGQQSSAGSQSDSGILLSGTCENIAVSGNTIYDDQGTATQQYGIYRDGSDFCSYTGNIVHGNASGQFGGTLGTNSAEAANVSYS